MQTPLIKFAVDMLSDVAEHCKLRSATAAGEKLKLFQHAAKVLPDIMNKLADKKDEDSVR